MLTRPLVITALTLLTSLPAAAQSGQLDGRSAQVDSLMSALVGPAAPGAAVLVVQDGKVVHQRGYGLANVETRLPIATNTTFDLASVSKQFTAMAIMMLAERGKLAYDDPLTKFFPEFPAYATRITVRHLLNHTSGLPDYMSVFRQRPAGISSEPTSREALTMLAQITEPRFAPGEKWEYSNSGYVVLGQIVEKASGQSFPEFLKANVFGPLGMNTTLVSDQIKAPSANRAVSYAPAGAGFRDADYTPLNRIYGDGNVNTSVEDMYRWDQALYTDRLVKSSTMAEAFTPAKLNNGSATDYGFGWRIENADGRRVVSHGGAWVGFRTYIMRVPAERFSVIVLSNLANFDPGAAARRIARVYLGTGPAAPAELAVAPFTVEADSAGVLRAAADTCLERLVAGLTAKGITVTRLPRLIEKTLSTARPVPWAILGHVKRAKGEVSAEIRVMNVADGAEMVSYFNSGKDVQAVIVMEKISARIAAFVQERRPKTP